MFSYIVNFQYHTAGPLYAGNAACGRCSGAPLLSRLSDDSTDDFPEVGSAQKPECASVSRSLRGGYSICLCDCPWRRQITSAGRGESGLSDLYGGGSSFYQHRRIFRENEPDTAEESKRTDGQLLQAKRICA